MDYEATDRHAYRMAKAQEFRDLLYIIGKSRRALAADLREAGVHTTDRQVRYWFAGQADIPLAAWLYLDSITPKCVHGAKVTKRCAECAKDVPQGFTVAL